MIISNFYGYKNYDELKDKMEKDNNLSRKVNNFYLARINMEIIKKNSSTIKNIYIGHKSKHNKSISKYSIKIGEKILPFKIKEAREFDDKDKLKIEASEDGELKLNRGNMLLEPGKKYYYVIPNKSDSIYLSDDSKGEHHSNFKWNKEKNPNFSVVAGGYFILDDKNKIAKVTNDSGHFRPTSVDCTESFLRILAKNMFSFLDEKGLNGKSKGIEDLLSESKKTSDKGYNISIDTTKCETNLVTLDSKEPEEAVTIISKRRLDLINRNARSSIKSKGIQ